MQDASKLVPVYAITVGIRAKEEGVVRSRIEGYIDWDPSNLEFHSSSWLHAPGPCLFHPSTTSHLLPKGTIHADLVAWRVH